MAKGQIKQKLTEETIGKLREAFSYDAPVTEACAIAGIHPDTYYRWIKEVPGLSDEFSRLRSNPTYKARKVWVDSFDKDPRNAIEYLRRKRSEEFGDKVQADLSIDAHFNISGDVKVLVQNFEQQLLDRYSKGEVIEALPVENETT